MLHRCSRDEVDDAVDVGNVEDTTADGSIRNRSVVEGVDADKRDGVDKDY